MFRLIVLLIILTAGYSQVGNFSFTSVRSAPRVLNYQGYLTDTLGNPINNGSLAMTFKIYDASTGGNELWSESQTVDVAQGIFQVVLGSSNPIPDSVFTGGTDRWLELIVDGNILSPRTRIVAVGYAYTATYSDTAEYARNVTGDNDWVRGASPLDSVLFTGNYLGIARGGAGTMLYGDSAHTHVNLGVACTTGTSGWDVPYCVVGGGFNNVASESYSGVLSGSENVASSVCAFVGGWGDSASGSYAVVVGGWQNKARGRYSVDGGGRYNLAGDDYAVVGGGYSNEATGYFAVIGGGNDGEASDTAAVVVGGWDNSATGKYSFIGGGFNNVASESYSGVLSGSENVASSVCAFVWWLGGFCQW